jgi:hypothetical protein
MTMMLMMMTMMVTTTIPYMLIDGESGSDHGTFNDET